MHWPQTCWVLVCPACHSLSAGTFKCSNRLWIWLHRARLCLKTQHFVTPARVSRKHMRSCQINGQRLLPAWALLEAAAACGRLLTSDGADGDAALQGATLGAALHLPLTKDSSPGFGFALRMGTLSGCVVATCCQGGLLLSAGLAMAHNVPTTVIDTGGDTPPARASLSQLASVTAAAAAVRSAHLPSHAACTASMHADPQSAGRAKGSGAGQWLAPAAAEGALALQTVADAPPGHPSSLTRTLVLAACAGCVFSSPGTPPQGAGSTAAWHAAVRPEPDARWGSAPRCRAVLRGAGGAPVLEACGVTARRSDAATPWPDDCLAAFDLFMTVWQRVAVPKMPVPARQGPPALSRTAQAWCCQQAHAVLVGSCGIQSSSLTLPDNLLLSNLLFKVCCARTYLNLAGMHQEHPTQQQIFD